MLRVAASPRLVDDRPHPRARDNLLFVPLEGAPETARRLAERATLPGVPARERFLRAPLDAALAEQLEQLEQITVRVLQLLTGTGVGYALVISRLSSRLGFATAANCAFLFAWFSLYGWMLGRRNITRGLRVANVVIESTLPWQFFVAISLSEGPVYALSSWVPPMMFCVLVVAHCARLNPRGSLALGVAGSASYLLAYFVVAMPRIPAASAAWILTQPPMQIGRASGLFMSGFLGAMVARALLRAIGRAESDVRARDLFGKYRLEARIAAGGMGEVYSAIYCPEGGFERRVAVKRVHDHLARQPVFVQAFREEAELSARLAHPNVVQVLDFGRTDAGYFLAMEFVDGLTLSALMFRAARSGVRLSPTIVGHILRDILTALDYAHSVARGADGRPLRVVHRDLCPQNVLISRNGEVKLTDFGIARSLSDHAQSVTKNIAGHIGYMAPEQARTEPFDERADLFPVGVMAWELFTRRPLFRRENEVASLLSLLNDEVVPVVVHRPDIHARWSDLIAMALEREPKKRAPSARALQVVLDEIPDSRDARAAEELAAMVRGFLELPATADAPDEEPTRAAQ